MDLRQQCLYCSKTYSYIGAYITHLRRDHKERIVYVSAEQLPDDGFAIEHDSILLPFVHEPHHDPFLHPSDDDSSDTEADSENACIDPEQPPVRTRICGTPQLDNRLAGKPISNEYFDVFDDEIDLWSPFSCEEEYRLAHWCVKHNLSRAAINELFRNPTMATVSNFTSSHTLFKRLNEMSYAMGIDSWKSGKVCYNRLADPNNLRDDDYTRFFYRNPVECIEFLMQQPAFREHMSYAPAKEFNDAEERIYSEVKSSDWWWNEQLRRPLGATIVPLFGSSDQTHLTNYSGDKKEWPVYLSLGNIDSTIRSKPSNLASILVALLPVPPKYHFKGHGKTTAVKEQQIHNREVLRKVFELIFRPLDALFNTGKLMLCADGRMRQCYPVICAWTADYFENIHLHSIKQPHCPVCEAPKSSFGEGNSSSWQLRDYRLYFQKMILATQGDETERWEARQYLEDRAVGTSEGVFWNMKCISPTTIIVPDILHTIYLGMLKHLMDWVTSFLEQHSRIDKFNQLWAMMPPYPGFARFNKPYSQVTQWSGKEMKALGRVIVPVFAATLLTPSASQRIPFTEALLCVKNLVYFHLMAQYRYHTEATIEYMENYLEEFHRHKDVFSRFRASKSTKKVSEALKKQLTLDKQEERESDPAWNNLSAAAKRRRVDEDKTQIESEIAQHLVDESDFNFVKMHLLNHFSDHIRQLGNLLNVSSELPEKAMMDLKQAYRQSNRHEAAFQILRTKARKEVFQYRELNANAAKQRRDDDMPLTKAPIKRMMKNPQPEIKTLDDLAEWCAMPKGELQNHIAWCFKRFADFTDYVDHDQYFSRLNDAKYIRYNAVAIPVTSFQCDEQAVHMVRCTGSTRWRKHKPPRNDTVLLWMGTSPDSHFKSTAGRIPARLKCLFVVEDAESSVKGLLALVQTFATGPIRQTAGMVIVEERHQPPMQPLHDGSYRRKPLFGVGTTYIVPISAIQGAVHLLPLTPQPDSSRWYLSNTIDLNAFNLFYM